MKHQHFALSAKSQKHGFSTEPGGANDVPRGNTAVSGDIFSCHNCGQGDATGIEHVEARNGAKYPAMDAQKAPHNRIIEPKPAVQSSRTSF